MSEYSPSRSLFICSQPFTKYWHKGLNIFSRHIQIGVDMLLVLQAAERNLHAKRGHTLDVVERGGMSPLWNMLHRGTKSRCTCRQVCDNPTTPASSSCYLSSTHSENVDHFTALASATPYCQERDQASILKTYKTCESDIVCHLLYSR